MAASRTEKVGSIFYRIQGLLRSGAMAEAEKPLWYDVYEAFPPKVEPKYDRILIDQEPRELFYKEDVIRARFYQTFQADRPAIDLTDEENPSLSQKFVQKYEELEKSTGSKSQNELFKWATEAVEAEGFTLRTLEEIKQEAQNKKKQLAKMREEQMAKEAERARRLQLQDSLQLEEERDDDDATEEDFREDDSLGPPVDRS